MGSSAVQTGRAFAVADAGHRQGEAISAPYVSRFRTLLLLAMLPVVPFARRREQLERLFSRLAVFDDQIDGAVRRILEEVRSGGDAAVLDCTERFDGVRPASLLVDAERLAEAHARLNDSLRGILVEAADAIRRFHEKERRASWFETGEDGAGLGQRYTPMERVGVYAPGGTAAYPSSVLMNVIPAQVAGVEHLYLASPPGPDGLPHPLVLAAAHMLGVEHVFSAGGAQAIAMFAFGTETAPRVDKIAGPGNAWVATAKKQVYGLVDIDSVAGPSEIVVLADASANPRFAAADLLAQAEHDPRASAVLTTPDAALAEAVRRHAAEMTASLPRRAIVEASLAEYGACIVTDTLEEAIQAANELAPEHLEILTRDPASVLPRIRHAGAIFLGPFSPEPVGDYFAGPNHVLPTGGAARYASALGVDDFVRRQSVIAWTEARLARTAPRIAAFARAEGLEAHARAVEVRLAEDISAHSASNTQKDESANPHG